MEMARQLLLMPTMIGSFQNLIFTCVFSLFSLVASAAIQPRHPHVLKEIKTPELSESSSIVQAIDANQVVPVQAWLKAGNSPVQKIKNRLHEKLIDRAAMRASKEVFFVLLQAVKQQNLKAALTDFRGTPLLVSITSRAVPGQKLTPKFEQMAENFLDLFPEAANDKDHAYIGDGRTALHQAAANGDVRLLKKLVAHGAQVDAKNSTGETPLHLAARFGHIDSIRYLIFAGAKINEKTTFTKATPLMSAAEMGQASAIRQLIASGAKKDERDVFGKTAPERYREYAGNFVQSIAPKTKRN